MLGYVVPDKPELKIREYELYSAYYCGICKSIERRYGQLPRLALNYDAVLLALIVSSLDESKEELELQRCPVHPVKKKLIAKQQEGIDYAADIMLLLAYFKAMDDRQDEGGIKATGSAFLLSRYYKKMMKSHKEKSIIIEDCLAELSKLEKEGCPSLDRAAEPFAKLMEEVFAAEKFRGTPEIEEGLRRIGYHIGKWIYLIDAFDDMADNMKNRSYNPLLAQAGVFKGEDMDEDLKQAIRERVERNLLLYLAELAKAWEKIKTNKNQGLLENIVYLGLLRKTEQILGKGTIKNAKPI